MKYLRGVKIFLVLALLAFLAFLGWGYARDNPEDLPWTELDLARPIGAFTGRKLAGLGGEGEACRAHLRRAGIRFVALPRRGGGQCGYEDAVRFAPGGASSTSRSVAASCSTVKGLPRSRTPGSSTPLWTTASRV